MISRSLVRDVYWVLGSRRGNDASRRTFQPRCYGGTHTGTECLVHVEVTGFAVSYAFDFSYAMEFVVVAHLRLARFTCLLDFRDGYYARSGLLDHLNSDGFDCGSDGLFHPPRGLLRWRALGLGNRSLGRFRSLGCLTRLTALG
jgi:hypothetical protein